MSKTTSEKNVLDPGTVEARGLKGDKQDEVAREIEEFLNENTLGIRTELRCFLNIFVFVTALPCPAHWAGIHPGFLMKGMCYFPVAGAIVGFIVSQVFDFGLLLWGLPVVVAVALSTAASLKITGCLHEDGLADTADGMGGGWTRQQILRIMSDSRLGTFGSAALMLYIFTKLHLLAALGTSRWEVYDFGACINQETCGASVGSQGSGPALLVAHTLARLTAPYLIWRCDYIEEDGPKSNFYSFMIRAKFLVSIPRMLFSLVFSYWLAATLYGPILSAQLIIAIWICAECAGSYGRRKLGGVMGDFLGGTICITELFIYASLAAKSSALDAAKRFREILMNTNVSSSDRLKAILQDDKTKLMIRFVLLAFLYQSWCLLVRLVEEKHAEQERKEKIPNEKKIQKSD